MTNLRKPTFNKPLLISRKQKKNALFTIVLGSMITFLGKVHLIPIVYNFQKAVLN